MIKDETQKKYYITGEVSEILKESEYTIVLWTKKFGLDRRIRRNSFQQRLYTKENIQQLEEIRDLIRNFMFTMKGAKNIFLNNLTVVLTKKEL